MAFILPLFIAIIVVSLEIIYEGTIKINVVFTTLMFLLLLESPFIKIPNMILGIKQFFTSMLKIEKFLLTKEINKK
jgi:hypothetical protein